MIGIQQSKNMKNNQKEQIRITKLFLFLPLLAIFLFIIIPVILMIFYSFTNWDGYSPSYEIVGMMNYNTLFTPDNMQPYIVTIYYLFGAIIQLIIGIYLAVYVYFCKRNKALLIIIILLPVLINTVAVGLIFRQFLMPGGMFDMILDKLHIIDYTSAEESLKWIGNSDIVNYTLTAITIWRFTPFTFILIYGAFLSIDENLIKAAIQLGASKTQIAINVLLPNIRVTLVIVITTLVIGAISTVELPMIMTNGDLGTQTIVMRINEVAFAMRDFGQASVISIFTCIIIVLVVLLRYCIGGNVNEKS